MLDDRRAAPGLDPQQLRHVALPLRTAATARRVRAAAVPGDVLDQLRPAHLCRRRLEHHPAVAHHGHVVGDVEHLLQAVGDVEHRDAVGRAAGGRRRAGGGSPRRSATRSARRARAASRCCASPRAITTSRRCAIERLPSGPSGRSGRRAGSSTSAALRRSSRRLTNARRHLRIAEPELDVLGDGHVRHVGQFLVDERRGRVWSRRAARANRTGSPSIEISPSSG